MRSRYSLSLRRIQVWIFTRCILKLMRISISLQQMQKWNTVKRIKRRSKKWERKRSQKMLSYVKAISVIEARSRCPFPTTNIAGCVASTMMNIKLTLIQRNMPARSPSAKPYMTSSKRSLKISIRKVPLRSGKHLLWRLCLTRNNISNTVYRSNWNSLALEVKMNCFLVSSITVIT